MELLIFVIIALAILGGLVVLSIRAEKKEKELIVFDLSEEVVATPVEVVATPVVEKETKTVETVKKAPSKKAAPKKEPKSPAKAEVAAKRTRKDGKFVADDPSTPGVNEAFIDGKAPEPKKRGRKPKAAE